MFLVFLFCCKLKEWWVLSCPHTVSPSIHETEPVCLHYTASFLQYIHHVRRINLTGSKQYFYVRNGVQYKQCDDSHYFWTKIKQQNKLCWQQETELPPVHPFGNQLNNLSLNTEPNAQTSWTVTTTFILQICILILHKDWQNTKTYYHGEFMGSSESF
jgi:hypothetical protein